MAQIDLNARSLVRSFTIDEDEGVVVLNPKLYGEEKENFLRATRDLLSNSELYGVETFTILGDQKELRTLLYQLDYVEWDIATHSFLIYGYRTDVDDVLAKTLHWSYNNYPTVPDAISVRVGSVVLEWEDGYDIVSIDTLQKYWDECC